MQTLNIFTIIVTSSLLGSTVHAAEPEGSSSVGIDASGMRGDGEATGAAADAETGRIRPRPHDVFLGLFGGVFLPDSNIELGDQDKVIDSYDRIAGEVGVRLGYYPVRHFGMEGELAAIPARYQGDRAFAYAARIQGVIQPGFWRVTPFALLGGGVLGVRSGSDVVGNESDQALHVGGGIKVLLSERAQMRLDVRDVISPRQGASDRPVHSPEALLAFAVRFGVAPKPKPVAEIPDRDGDGVADELDHCPFDAGADGQGCPFPDSDCDDVADNVDACPQVQGIAPEGCPPPDADSDGVLDAVDECPNEAGDPPNGCPVKDSDQDGLMDTVDKCPNEPETFNGIDDADGCPDELPPEVKKFSGVIQGIFFDTGKDTIKSTSEAVLDNAAKVLAQYPQLKVEIVGHTDDRGSHDRNVDLSQRRAESVKTYLTERGVDANAVSTRGAGPDEPLADNKSKAGRAKNRRIEFKLVQ